MSTIKERILACVRELTNNPAIIDTVWLSGPRDITVADELELIAGDLQRAELEIERLRREIKRLQVTSDEGWRRARHHYLETIELREQLDRLTLLASGKDATIERLRSERQLQREVTRTAVERAVELRGLMLRSAIPVDSPHVDR